MQDRILVDADGTARREFETIGPWPDQTVAMFADLGLTDEEIDRYFGLDQGTAKTIPRGDGPCASAMTACIAGALPSIVSGLTAGMMRGTTQLWHGFSGKFSQEWFSAIRTAIAKRHRT
jgi:hypothetical protein